MRPETFPLLLQTALLYEETRSRDELQHYIRVGEQPELVAYARGCLQSIGRMRECQSPLDLLALMASQSASVDRHSPRLVTPDYPFLDRRSNLTYLWHLGQLTQMEVVAKVLKVYERHDNG